jgi:GxxExxY protein
MSNNYRYSEPPRYLDEIGNKIVDTAYIVHNKLGPGLLEHVYQIAMMKELAKKGLAYKSEVYIPLKYDDLIIDKAYKIDILVENEIVVELKTVERLALVHYKQIRTYMKLNNSRLGFLINFNTAKIKDGIERQILSLPEE